MARDLLLGRSSRNWSRGLPTSGSGASAGGKVAMGGMALGTFLGVAFVTSPWWSSFMAPGPARTGTHSDYTGVPLQERSHCDR
jgi:hypothetical protein